MPEPNVDKLTPPPELVREWVSSCSPYDPPCDHIATQAARWGADQELEACCEWLTDWRCNDPSTTMLLRADRRPKPPSLKEQALLAIDTAVADDRLSAVVADVVRRALEAQ